MRNLSEPTPEINGFAAAQPAQWRILRSIVEDQGLTAAAKATAFVLLDHYDPRTGRSCLSYREIADHASVDRSTARAAVKQLADRQWFVSTSGPGGRGNCNAYHPNFDLSVRVPIDFDPGVHPIIAQHFFGIKSNRPRDGRLDFTFEVQAT